VTTISFQEFQQILYDQPKKMEKFLKKETVFLMSRSESYAKRFATGTKENPPRVWTGRLRSSIKPEALPHGQFGFSLRAGGQSIAGHVGVPADVEYAARIEFGDSELKPRLFMGRAIHKVQEEDLPETLRRVVKLSLGERGI